MICFNGLDQYLYSSVHEIHRMNHYGAEFLQLHNRNECHLSMAQKGAPSTKQTWVHVLKCLLNSYKVPFSAL